MEVAEAERRVILTCDVFFLSAGCATLPACHLVPHALCWPLHLLHLAMSHAFVCPTFACQTLHALMAQAVT